MRKPEQKVWDYLDRQMGRRWHVQRHEDRYSLDIPDLSYGLGGTDGWIELKTIPRWPANPAKPVAIPHLRPGQVNWIEDRNRYGNCNTWMLLVVGATPAIAEWALIPGSDLRKIYDRTLTEADIKFAYRVCSGPEIADVLGFNLV